MYETATCVDAFIGSVVEALQEDAALAGIDMLREFPRALKDHPQLRPAVAVGLKSCEFTDLLGGYLGADASGGAVYGRRARLTLALDIYTPLSMDGETCHSVFSKLADAAFRADLGGTLRAVQCSGIAYSRARRALILPAELQLDVMFRAPSAVDPAAYSAGEVAVC